MSSIVSEHAYKYIVLGIAGLHSSIQYSLKIRRLGKLKSIYFSIVIFIIFLATYLYYFMTYQVSFLDWQNLFLIFILVAFIYNEYIFRVYPLETLEKKYKPIGIKEIKNFISKDYAS